jgi:hypothetical protein
VVTRDAAKSVTATFDVLAFLLSVSRNGTGAGAVTSSPAGIDCGADCSESYLFGTTVNLTPSASAGSQFTGWSGHCVGVGPCAVTMDAARSVTANFTAGGFNLDFYTVAPCRVFDTRTGAGAIPSGSMVVFPVAGACGIPGDARAAALNVTVVTPTGAGYLTLFPSDQAAPATSTLTFAGGIARSNNAVLLLSSGTGSLAVLPVVGGGGQVHVVVDVGGYFR